MKRSLMVKCIDEKNRFFIPKQIREEINLKGGDEIQIFYETNFISNKEMIKQELKIKNELINFYTHLEKYKNSFPYNNSDLDVIIKELEMIANNC